MPTTTTRKAKTTPTAEYVYQEGGLPVLYSCRVRLSEAQRETLKEALNEFRRSRAPEVKPAVLPGSTIQVQTNQVLSHNVYAEYGLSDAIVSDLIRTRETIALPILLNLQRLLGVVVIERKELQARFKAYLDYLGVE